MNQCKNLSRPILKKSKFITRPILLGNLQFEFENNGNELSPLTQFKALRFIDLQAPGHNKEEELLSSLPRRQIKFDEQENDICSIQMNFKHVQFDLKKNSTFIFETPEFESQLDFDSENSQELQQSMPPIYLDQNEQQLNNEMVGNMVKEEIYIDDCWSNFQMKSFDAGKITAPSASMTKLPTSKAKSSCMCIIM